MKTRASNRITGITLGRVPVDTNIEHSLCRILLEYLLAASQASE